MQHLDVDPTVATWSYERIIIPYVSNLKTGRIRKYYPDFFVTRASGAKELIEIKPVRRVKQAAVQKKLAAAREWCTNNPGVALVVLTENELRVLGVL